MEPFSLHTKHPKLYNHILVLEWKINGMDNPRIHTLIQSTACLGFRDNIPRPHKHSHDGTENLICMEANIRGYHGL